MNKETGNFMFGVVPNEKGEIECVAQLKENQIDFKITESDINHMLRYIYLWKANKLIDKEVTP